jgi:L-alanine-DL-glutamate epimerase-like enolase superfamily enzyme
MCPHWLHELHAHLVASAPNARYVEYFPDDKVLNFRKLLNRQLEAKEGQLLLPQTPGLGFEFDESAISKFGVNSPQPWTIVQ